MLAINPLYFVATIVESRISQSQSCPEASASRSWHQLSGSSQYLWRQLWIVGLERLRLHVSDISIYFLDFCWYFFSNCRQLLQLCGCQDAALQMIIVKLLAVKGRELARSWPLKVRWDIVMCYTILCYLPRYIRKGSMERMLSHVDIIDSQYAKGTPENIIAT